MQLLIAIVWVVFQLRSPVPAGCYAHVIFSCHIFPIVVIKDETSRRIWRLRHVITAPSTLANHRHRRRITWHHVHYFLQWNPNAIYQLNSVFIVELFLFFFLLSTLWDRDILDRFAYKLAVANSVSDVNLTPSVQSNLIDIIKYKK